MIQVSFIDIDIIEGSGSGSSPVGEPVSLQEVKDHLYIEGTQDDALLTRLISQCRSSIENFCHISLVDKTITASIEVKNTPTLLFRSAFSSIPALNEFELPEGPVISVDQVSSIDANNSINVLELDKDYWMRGLLFKTLRINNSYANNIIVYQTGYDNIPQGLILAILNEIAFRFENRGESVNRYAQQNVGISEAAQALAKPYQRQSWQ